MQKHFKRLMSNQKQRTAFFICAIIVFIAAVIVFIGFELVHNQSLYISNYMTEQQKLNDQVTIRFKHYISEDQLSIDDTVNQIVGEVETSGSRFWFIAADEKLLFVKSDTTTDMYSFTSLTTFIHDNKTDNLKVTFSSFSAGEVKYTIGICTSESYIKEGGELFRHNVYVIMPLILISAFIIVIVIFAILMINRQEITIKKLKADAIDRNMTIEQLTTRFKKTRLNDLGGSRDQTSENKEKVIYDKQVLASLLDKINRENIIPLTIIIIELTSKTRTFMTKDYQLYIKSISQYINQEHVLAEIITGVYSILLFHTFAESNEEIKQTLINEWALPLKKQGVKVRMGISCIEDYDSNVENVFEIVYKEVASMHTEQMQLNF